MADNKLDIKAFLDKDEQKDLLRLLTAGSVDDGKSTLIGRLLFDSKKLYEDQLDALERDSKRVGNAGEHIDYALLLDGLKNKVLQLMWLIATSPPMDVNLSLRTLRDMSSTPVI
jgi:hypothetical protein